MKNGKRYLTHGMELPNRDKIRTPREKETNKYLGILEADNIKWRWKKKWTSVLQENEKDTWNQTIQQETYPKNKYLGCSSRMLFGTILEVNQKRNGPENKKLMTKPKAQHPRDDFDRLHGTRKEGGTGLANIEDSADASIQRLEDYIKRFRGRCLCLCLSTKTISFIVGNLTGTTAPGQNRPGSNSD